MSTGAMAMSAGATSTAVGCESAPVGATCVAGVGGWEGDGRVRGGGGRGEGRRRSPPPSGHQFSFFCPQKTHRDELRLDVDSLGLDVRSNRTDVEETRLLFYEEGEREGRERRWLA